MYADDDPYFALDLLSDKGKNKCVGVPGENYWENVRKMADFLGHVADLTNRVSAQWRSLPGIMGGQNIKYLYMGGKVLKKFSSKPCKKIPSVILKKLGGVYIAPPLFLPHYT